MSTTITTEANLTADPELRFTKTTGQSVATLRLAVSARRKNIDGDYVDTPPVFYEATCWGALAEHAAESLRKGDRVLVHGSAYDEEWTDRDNRLRVKHVLQVQGLGASLRYATTTITRATSGITDRADQPGAAACEPAAAG
jgi:single-strand DNA-binding protein